VRLLAHHLRDDDAAKPGAEVGHGLDLEAAAGERARATENATLKEEVAALQQQLTTYTQTLARWESRFAALERATARAGDPNKAFSANSQAAEGSKKAESSAQQDRLVGPF
jgi:hypothetical protein